MDLLIDASNLRGRLDMECVSGEVAAYLFARRRRIGDISAPRPRLLGEAIVEWIILAVALSALFSAIASLKLARVLVDLLKTMSEEDHG